MRSLSEYFRHERQAAPALAGAPAFHPASPTVLLRGERARRRGGFLGLSLDKAPPRGLGSAMAILLLLAVASVGAVRGGHYRAFVESEGGVGDFLARAAGLGVKAITMTGQSRLAPADVLRVAGVSPKSSMPFFDVEAAREGLEKTPLVKRASVRKLYPGQIVIDLDERAPAALWQNSGEVKTIAADGAVIDELGNASFADLPFVVGEGANGRLAEFAALLDKCEELRAKIAAGVLVDGRRWNLRFRSGVDVKLPQSDPSAAIVELLRLQRGSRILDRDVLWVDLRTPGKAFVRLSADAAATRAEARPKKGATP